MIDASTATFLDLVAGFPDFDEQALRARCKAELVTMPQPLIAALDAHAAAHSADVQNAVGLWAKNNEEMVQLDVGLRSGDRDDEIGKALRRRRAKMKLDPFFEMMSAADQEDYARVKVAAFERGLSALSTAFCPMAGIDVPAIHRGFAFDAADASQCLEEGQSYTWSHMRACTVSPDFVPLFYANKQFRCLTSSTVCSVAVMLKVSLVPSNDPVLIWAGAAKGSGSYNTYDWQAEVVTPPGFRFRVDRVNRASAVSSPTLLTIEATQVLIGHLICFAMPERMAI